MGHLATKSHLLLSVAAIRQSSDRCDMNPSNMEWSIETTTSFIEDYHNSPELWNNKLRDYKDQRVKNDLLKELAQKYNCTVPEAKKKIKNLRTAFHRERKKLNSKKSGSSPPKKGKWFAYDLLSFLADVDLPKSTLSTADSDEEEVFEGEEQEGSRDSQHSQVEFVDSEKLQELSNKRVRNSCDEERLKGAAPKKKTRKSSSPSAREEEAYNILKNVCQRDDCSTYGEYVACEMRKLGAKTQTIVKHMMNNILFEAAMGKFETSSTDIASSSGTVFSAGTENLSRSSTRSSTPAVQSDCLEILDN